MSGNNNKLVTILSLGIAVFALNAYSTPTQGDIYYPNIGQEKMPREQIQAMHEERLKKMETEYQAKMKALEVRYQEKVKQAEARHKEMMEKRESLADFKKERMQKRNELQKEYVNQRTGFENADADSKNPYMMQMQERQEYFEKKNGMKAQ